MSNERYDVCVIGGVGRVGLPLGLSLADAGQRVVLYDINEAAVQQVQRGQMPFREHGAEEVLKRVLGQRLFATVDRTVVRDSHFIVIVIGTPVDEHLNPQYVVFKRFLSSIMDLCHDGQHLILRSTVFPGTTEKVTRYLREKGKATWVSFCPERIAEGRAMEELHSLPQIVSSSQPEAVEEAKNLFLLLTKDVLVLSPMEAEIAKLFTNVWRYILFSISNQFYEIAVREGVDFYKVYEAITHKYPRIQGFPRPGFAAGPCLFKDTMQLAAFSENNFFLGHVAMLINEGLPNFLVQQIKAKYALASKTVGILGMAFKANCDDKRESLSCKLRKILEVEAKCVLCSDIYVQEPEFISPEELIRRSDIVVLGVPHREYAHLDLGDRIVVDMWDFYGRGGRFA